MTMNPERWREVEAIYHAALERPEADRTSFLREACGGDPELLHEVESLLEFDSRGERLLESGPSNNEWLPSGKRNAGSDDIPGQSWPSGAPEHFPTILGRGFLATL